MYRPLTRVVTPTIFDDEEKLRIARLLNVILLTMTAGNVIFALVVLALTPYRLDRLLLSVLMFGVVFAMLWFLRKGYTRNISIGLCCIVWVIVTVSCLITGGLQAPGFAAYMLVIMLAGYLVSSEAGILTAALSALAGLLILYKPGVSISEIMPIWSIDVVYFVIVAVLQAAVTQSIRQTLMSAQCDKQALLEANRQLALEIEEREHTEESLRQSEAFFRFVAESIPANVSVSSESGEFLFVNGRTRESMEGAGRSMSGSQTSQYYAHPEARAQFIQDLKEKGEINNREVLTRNADGTLAWRLISVRRTVFQGQSAFLAVSQDISEHKQHDEMLARLSTIVEHSHDAIVSRDLNGILNSWNKAAERIYGYAAEEVLGQPFTKLIPPEKMTEELALHEQLIQGGYIEEYESTRLHKNGNFVPVRVNIFPLRDASGAISGGSGIIHDLTQQKSEALLREELAQEKALAAMRERFSSMVSHEFRTPLTVIQSSGDLLKRYYDRMTEERRLDHLNKIDGQVRRMVDMLDDVLALSKATAVGFPFNPTELDLAIFCEDLVEEVRFAHGRQEIIYMVMGKPVPVTMDIKLLRQILLNLLTNAVKYSPPQTDVNLNVEFQPNQMTFTVKDRGISIPEADQKHLFEMFHRAGNVGNINGTGLGLAIVKRAIEAHGGTITFESTPDVGTTFIVNLPSGR